MCSRAPPTCTKSPLFFFFFQCGIRWLNELLAWEKSEVIEMEGGVREGRDTADRCDIRDPCACSVPCSNRRFHCHFFCRLTSRLLKPQSSIDRLMVPGVRSVFHRLYLPLQSHDIPRPWRFETVLRISTLVINNPSTSIVPNHT